MPAVTGIRPTSGPQAGSTVVTLSGVDFVEGSTVDFGSKAATSVTVKSGTSLMATSPSGPPGSVDITVTTPFGTSATVGSDRFTYDATPPPTPEAGGYWETSSDGGIFAFGDAGFFGSTGGIPSTHPSWGWPRPRTARATGWSPPTAGSSPSATPASTDRRGPAPQQPDRRDGRHPGRQGLLVGGLRRRHLRLR